MSPDAVGDLFANSSPRAELFQSYRESLHEDRRILVDCYRLVDVAIKIVGVGSVGRRCWIPLMMSEGNEPLFLQFKEAVHSVLEPCAGGSAYGHHGQGVLMGQRLMQPASDIFPGRMTANGRHFYVRQLHDAKIKPLVEIFNAEMLDVHAHACGWALARAHAKASENFRNDQRVPNAHGCRGKMAATSRWSRFNAMAVSSKDLI